MIPTRCQNGEVFVCLAVLLYPCSDAVGGDERGLCKNQRREGFRVPLMPDTVTREHDRRMLLLSDRCPVEPNTYAEILRHFIHLELQRFSQLSLFVQILLSEIVGQGRETVTAPPDSRASHA